MNWFQKFMLGRYGVDQLSFFMLVLSIIISLVAQIFRIPFLGILVYIILGFSMFRILSRNIQKRSMENYKFSIFISPIYKWFLQVNNRAKHLKTHKYYKCPTCRKELRVPKGKGKIKITCPWCKAKFIKKT